MHSVVNQQRFHRKQPPLWPCIHCFSLQIMREQWNNPFAEMFVDNWSLCVFYSSASLLPLRLFNAGSVWTEDQSVRLIALRPVRDHRASESTEDANNSAFIEGASIQQFPHVCYASRLTTKSESSDRVDQCSSGLTTGTNNENIPPTHLNQSKEIAFIGRNLKGRMKSFTHPPSSMGRLTRAQHYLFHMWTAS